MDDAQSEIWWIPDFQDENMTYEYTYLDLDGDGVAELLIQMEDAPYNYNGVFHFENDKIICWNSDAMEMSCWDYPLSDGTMVRQYDVNGTSTYNIFRYTANGEIENIQSLFGLEEEFDTLVTGKMLERWDWTIIGDSNGLKAEGRNEKNINYRHNIYYNNYFTSVLLQLHRKYWIGST